MRKQFGETLFKLAKKDPLIYLVVGDIGYGTFDKFKEKFPDRFYNIGVCEQSMVGIAAGMALEGLKPWVYTITPFLIERAFEQIKIDVDAMKTNVKLIGYADYPQHGLTHAELDAKNLMGLLKNIRCYFPKNSEETNQVVNDSYNFVGPNFISLKKNSL